MNPEKTFKALGTDNASGGIHVQSTMGNVDAFRANPVPGYNLTLKRPDGTTAAEYTWVGTGEQFTNASVSTNITVTLSHGHLKFSPK